MEGKHLLERGRKLYFRMRVPVALRAHIPLKEIKCSLDGMDLQSARNKSTLLAEELRKLFHRAMNGMVNMSILHPLVRQLCSNVLYFESYHRAHHTHTDITPKEFDQRMAFFRECHQQRRIDCADDFLKYARQQGLELDAGQLESLPVILDYYLGRIEVLRIQKERAGGNIYNGYDEAMPDGRFSQLLFPKDYSPDLPELSMPLPAPLAEAHQLEQRMAVAPPWLLRWRRR